MFEEAADTFMNSSVAFKMAKAANREANALTYAAKCFYYIGEDSIALNHHKTAIEIYKGICEYNGIMQNTYAIAEILENNNMILDAISYIEQINDTYNAGAIPQNFYPLLCKLHYKANSLEIAEKYGMNSIKLYEENSIEIAGIYLLLSKIYSGKKNYKLANFYNEMYIKLSDHLFIENGNLHMNEIESKYSQKKLNESYYKLMTKYKRNRVSYVISIVIVLAISIALYQQYKIRENFISNTANMQGATPFYYAEIIDFIKKLLDNAYITNNHPEKFYKKFEELTMKFTPQFYTDIIFIANKSSNGIIDYWKNEYPTLTDKELLYCSMIILGFSPNAIRMLFKHKNTTRLLLQVRLQ